MDKKYMYMYVQSDLSLATEEFDNTGIHKLEMLFFNEI